MLYIAFYVAKDNVESADSKERGLRMKNNYFKRGKYALVLLGILLLTACSKNDGNTKTDVEKTQSANQEKKSASEKESVQSSENVNLIDSKHPITEISESKLDLSAYGLDYEFVTDAQPEYTWTSIARAENGYYLWGNGERENYLMYFDITTGSYIPLCNKPNCQHDGEECNAFFNYSIVIGDVSYSRSYIQYYDGYVYVTGVDKKGYVYLYQVAADGSSCKEYMTLYKADLSSVDGEVDFSPPYVCIHRGYVYFIDKEESTLKVRRIELGKKDVEIVFENKDTRPSLYRMKAYGNYLFFQSGNFKDDDCVEIEAGIFALNVNTMQVQLIKKGAVADYTISDDCLYYATTSGINCYSLKDRTDEVAVDNGLSLNEVTVHGKYIYCYNDDSNALSQYDLEGKLLNQVTDDDLYQTCMGDSEYFFAYAIKAGRKIISLKDLSQGNAKWSALKDTD